MNFQSLNLNLNLKEMEKDFYSNTSHWPESCAHGPARVTRVAYPAWPSTEMSGPRVAGLAHRARPQCCKDHA
jgi:hypothetical protein